MSFSKITEKQKNLIKSVNIVLILDNFMLHNFCRKMNNSEEKSLATPLTGIGIFTFKQHCQIAKNQ